MRDLVKYLELMIQDMDAHILDINIGAGGRLPLVKLVVDTSDGITIDQLTSISRSLRDNEGIQEHIDSENYRLEVTSPGIDAGLTEPWQFPRHIGRQVRVQLQSPADQHEQPEQLTGELLRTDANGIHVQLQAGEQEIPWENIHQAHVQTKW
ncbi:ribosome maturation factor RimP [Candidatus Neomarinimicrobiota bacterium]